MSNLSSRSIQPPSSQRALGWLALLFVLLVVVAEGSCRQRGPLPPESTTTAEGQSAERDASSGEHSSTSEYQFAQKTTVLLISLDGFRWDYFDRVNTPNLDQLRNKGVQAKGLVPVFPSKTFPNHYSIVTGLFPENHGIVSNSMFDPVFRERFTITDANATTDGKWWEGEPIWVTAHKQGLKSATMFWPGSDAAIQGVRPTYYRKYDGRLPHTERVKQILTWLKLPLEQRPSFLTFYLEDVDTAGHSYGPSSIAVDNAIRAVDQTVGKLLKGIEELGLGDSINIIITSDHGMAELSLDRRIILSDYIDTNDVYINEISMVLSLNPKDGKLETVYQQLKDKHPHFKIYKKEEMPEGLHYRKHRRIGQLIGLADEGWTFVIHSDYKSIYAGSHGYDPKLTSMHGIFVAQGPAFKVGSKVPAFANIHIYALMCQILGLTPAPNDGKLEAVQNLLK